MDGWMSTIGISGFFLPSAIVDHLSQELQRGLSPVCFDLRHVEIVHEDYGSLPHGGTVHAWVGFPARPRRRENITTVGGDVQGIVKSI